MRHGDTLVCELLGGARWRVEAVHAGAGVPAAAAGAAADHSAAGPRAADVSAAGSAAATPSSVPTGVGANGQFAPGRHVRIMVRPEALRLRPAPGARGEAPATPAPRTRDGGAPPMSLREDAGPEGLEGTVLERHFAGPVTHYVVRAGEAERLVHGRSVDARPGESVVVQPEGGALVFPPA